MEEIFIFTNENSFGMKSTAPYSMAFIVASAPSVVSELIIIIGIGLVSIIFLTAVNPSILGISISIVITSGFNFWTNSRASKPSFALPTISKDGSSLSIISNDLRINAESSTINILVLSFNIL